MSLNRSWFFVALILLVLAAGSAAAQQSQPLILVLNADGPVAPTVDELTGGLMADYVFVATGAPSAADA